MTTAYAGAVVRIGAFAIPLVRLSSLVLAFAILTALHLFLAKARWGRAIRATAEDWEAAALMGIPVGRTYLLAFALGTALAGIAGGLVSVSYSISPSIGLEWTLKALIVVVLAGLGSLFGAFAGGILLGVAEATSVVFLGGPYREVVGLVLFLIILLVRPQGLFGGRGMKLLAGRYLAGGGICGVSAHYPAQRSPQPWDANLPRRGPGSELESARRLCRANYSRPCSLLWPRGVGYASALGGWRAARFGSCCRRARGDGFGVLIGVPAFRLRGAYFAIGTLGLAEILRITVGNLMPEISTIPAAALASYNILPRYYLTLGYRGALRCSGRGVGSLAGRARDPSGSGGRGGGRGLRSRGLSPQAAGAGALDGFGRDLPAALSPTIT